LDTLLPPHSSRKEASISYRCTAVLGLTKDECLPRHMCLRRSPKYGKSMVSLLIVVDVSIRIWLCESSESNDCGCVVDDKGKLSWKCDDPSRSVIGARYLSVFTARCRKAAHLAANGAEHSEVSDVNRSVTGKGW